ncbi:MAG: amidohydrolase family protein [bacterium]
MGFTVDFHVHAFPDEIASRAIANLEKTYNVRALSDGTINGLLESMDRCGIDVSVVQSVSTKPSQVRSINDWVARIRSERIVGFGTIHPQYEGFRDEIRRLRDMGVPGIKFQPDFQMFYPDDEAMFPIYEAIGGDFIVLFHAGNEIAPVEHAYSTPARLARVAEAFPGMKIVAAHLGGYRMWEEVEAHLVGKPIYLDISYVFGHLDTPSIMRIIEGHGADRTLFGTDFPFADPKKEIETLKRLPLNDGDKEKILGENGRALLALEKH